VPLEKKYFLVVFCLYKTPTYLADDDGVAPSPPDLFKKPDFFKRVFVL